MSPTVKREGKYRFFFNSREETRRHVHVATADGNAKYWLQPRIELATYYNLSSKELEEIEDLVREYANEITSAWNRHFGQ
ncbi:MAG: DUF4160 domain-containing protein [Chloroflexi bacterium]|nr:DUF4160 domain-containing protein [Chloroflexota bacterium]